MTRMNAAAFVTVLALSLSAYADDYERNMKEVKTLETKAWDHLKQSKSYRSYDAGEMKTLITKVCGLDHERDGDEADRLAQRMAQDAISRTKSKLSQLDRSHGQAEQGLHQAQKLITTMQTRWKAQAQRMKELQKSRDSISGLLGQLRGDQRAYRNVGAGNLYGTNNPKIRASVEYGQRKHKELQSSLGCDLAELDVGGGRVDCVKLSACSIWEIKPQGYSRGEALEQAQRYAAGVTEHVRKRPEYLRKLPASCVKADGKIDWDFDMKTYKGCGL